MQEDARLFPNTATRATSCCLHTSHERFGNLLHHQPWLACLKADDGLVLADPVKLIENTLILSCRQKHLKRAHCSAQLALELRLGLELELTWQGPFRRAVQGTCCGPPFPFALSPVLGDAICALHVPAPGALHGPACDPLGLSSPSRSAGANTQFCLFVSMWCCEDETVASIAPSRPAAAEAAESCVP